MSELDLSLEEEVAETRAMDEVQAIMGECFGFPVSMDAVADLRDSGEANWDEGLKWGFADTVVREALMSDFTTMLIEQPTPTYGEAREQNLDPEAFFVAVKVAHDEKYGEQPKPHWMP